MAIKLVIFDLDGTLVNTIEDVCDCFNRALMNCGYEQRPQEVISALIGRPLETIVAGLLPPDASKDEALRVAHEYRAVYGASTKPNTRPYPGVPQALHRLREAGIQVAVNSNKPHEAALEVVERMFLGVSMRVSGYGDVNTTKPSPEGALLLMREASVGPQETVYVGDTIVDLETAQNAGCPCVLVTWGQGTPSLFADSRAASVVSDAEELASVLIGL